MSANTTLDSWNGGAQAPRRWIGRELLSSGQLQPRDVYTDFGYPAGESPLDDTPGVPDCYSSEVVTFSAPQYVAPGAAFTANVTFRNIGDCSWEDFGSTPSQVVPGQTTINGGASFAGGPGIAPVVYSVAPAATQLWTLSAVAPLIPGTYFWDIVLVYTDVTTGYFNIFGAIARITIVVQAGPPSTLDSNFVTYALPFPPGMLPGSTDNQTVIFNNTGAANWVLGTHVMKMATNPANLFSITTVPLSVYPVLPGGNGSASFTYTAPSIPGNYTFQCRMFDLSTGQFFGEASQSITINVTEGGCSVLVAPVVTVIGSPGTTSYTYVYAAYSGPPSTVTLLGVSDPTTIVNGVDPWDWPNSYALITFPGFSAALHYRLWRTATSGAGGIGFVVGGPLGTFIDIGTVDPTQPVPTCAGGQPPQTAGSTAGVPPPSVPVFLDNILDGEAMNGSTGGEIIDGELVFDFTNTEFPFNQDGWPTADWPRSIFLTIESPQNTAIRIYGIDGYSAEVNRRFVPVAGTNGVNRWETRTIYWKVRKIVIETPNPLHIWIGFTSVLGLDYPAKAPLEMSGIQQGYLLHAIIDGEIAPIGDVNNPESCKLFVAPFALDPRGGFLGPASVLPNGLHRYEIIYIADRLDKLSSEYFDAMIEDELIVNLNYTE